MRSNQSVILNSAQYETCESNDLRLIVKTDHHSALVNVSVPNLLCTRVAFALQNDFVPGLRMKCQACMRDLLLIYLGMSKDVCLHRD